MVRRGIHDYYLFASNLASGWKLSLFFQYAKFSVTIILKNVLYVFKTMVLCTTKNGKV